MSRGGRGLLATPAGAVACELEPLGVDDTGARYELRVTNGTPGVLAATVSALRLDETIPVAALAVQIQPHAAVRTSFALDASMAYERITAEVHGDGIHMIVEAPPPRGGRPRRRWTGPVIALGAAGLLAGATLVGVAAERPRVVEATLLAGPNGSTVARWAIAGNGSPTYEVRDAHGDVVAHGTLPAAAGTMDVAIPGAASLRVAVANAFGSDARDAVYARATAPPAIRIAATPPPRIDSLAVDAPRPNAGVTVRYAAHARDLHLSVVDGNGATWYATTTPSGRGSLQIPAPPPGPREPYLLVARADGSDAREETRVPFPAAVQPAASPSPSSSPLAQATPAASAAPNRTTAPPEASVLEGAGGDTFAIRPDPAPMGRPVVVTVPSAEGARIQIVRDRDGLEVAGADVRRGERSATLTTPAQPGPYTVRVTMQRGRGLVSLVRPLHLKR